ncbi:MAG: molybdopterin-dependent oxidoreductase [Porticoccaceae bacterium]
MQELKAGNLRFAAEQPDNPDNFPRNLFVWRSNLLGSSGKGHEYMLKYLLGTKNGVMNEDNFARGSVLIQKKSISRKKDRKANWIW